MKMSMKDVLGQDDGEGGDGGEYSDHDEYDTHVQELADALDLDQDKAERLAHAICALARYEMDHDAEEQDEPEHMGGHKPSLMIVLGKKGK